MQQIGQLCASLSDSGHIPGRLSPTVCCTFSSGHSTPHMGPGKKHKMAGYQLQDEQDYVVKVIFSYHKKNTPVGTSIALVVTFVTR